MGVGEMGEGGRGEARGVQERLALSRLPTPRSLRAQHPIRRQHIAHYCTLSQYPTSHSYILHHTQAQ